MGWWQTYDGTVIGDELADIVDNWQDGLMGELLDKYGDITKDQILHTLAFCFNYIEGFDDGKKPHPEDKMLTVMTLKERGERSSGICKPDEDRMVAPGTALLNVRDPFGGEDD